MFGQNNNHDDDAKIPEQSIDGALNDEAAAATTPAPAPTWQHPGTPLDADTSAAAADDVHADTVAPDETSVTTTPSTTDEIPKDLIDIKQRALSQLAPLVSKLDQAPEERFRTTMMLIQASDDQTLIKDAYTAAQAITDEKARAQALLDIVNEINYFTQSNHAE